MSTAELRDLYPALRRHYAWFRRTQRGLVGGRPGGYRWRGRSPTHVLTSGLDDYPRATPHVGELHVDLACWMAAFGRTMADLAGILGEVDDGVVYLDDSRTLWTFIECEYRANLADLDDGGSLGSCRVPQRTTGAAPTRCIAISPLTRLVRIPWFGHPTRHAECAPPSRQVVVDMSVTRCGPAK